MQNQPYAITLLLLLTIFLIVLMGSFLLTILFLYRKKQISYLEKISEIQADYEKNLFKAQLEIQEQTFEHISREIHDNINLSLTLAKLNLNTIDISDNTKTLSNIDSSISLLTKSIEELRNLSNGLNSDLIVQQGLVRSIEDEMSRIQQVSMFTVSHSILGNPVFLNAQKELIIFRIIQEAFNNIIKHSKAHDAKLILNYQGGNLNIGIIDDGSGFDVTNHSKNHHAGLRNMENRAKILGGSMDILSEIGKGTTLKFQIPYETNGN